MLLYSSVILKVQLKVVRGSIGFVSVPVDLSDITEGVRDSVIVIQANEPISVKASIRELGIGTAAGLTLYPTNALSNYYVSVTAPLALAIIQVVSWNTGITQVDVVFPVNITTNGIHYVAGQKYTQYLQQYQVLVVALLDHLQAYIDLTGSTIHANQSVAAFSANQLATTAYGSSGDSSWEQLLPVTSWGTQFALVGTPKRTAGDYFKITTTTSATLIFTPAQVGDPMTVSSSSFAWVYQTSGTYRTLVSSAPIQVYLYAASFAKNETNGDPSATLVPPINQYAAAYQFSTFSGKIINSLLFAIEIAHF